MVTKKKVDLQRHWALSQQVIDLKLLITSEEEAMKEFDQNISYWIQKRAIGEAVIRSFQFRIQEHQKELDA
jgi:hypothetical protein